ncbi:MAG: ZIP family metal transporter [Bacteroidales bacterium]|nr:ZIP family metal transporter [Bacteroidales bacterium]
MISQVTDSALLLGGASLAGSALGFIFRRIPHRLNDIFLGYCAGMMLAAAIVCLAIPAVEQVGHSGLWQVALGIAAGAIVISMLDMVTPHLHNLTGLDVEEHHNNASLNRVLLFVIAIALHKLPEGMATGVAFDGTSLDNAESLSFSIALQNIPEGLVIITPLLMAGISWPRAMTVAAIVAGLEMAGVYIGYWVGSLSQAMLPALMGMASGAMIYVISDEMIPETHSHGYQKAATYALIAGFITLFFIE